MKTKRCLCYLLPLFFVSALFAQEKAAPEKKKEKEENDFLHNYNIMERIGSGSLANQTSLPSIPAPAAGVKGDVYLFPEYRLTTFQLYDNNKLAEGHKARFDIKNNEFDLRTQQGIRVLSGDRVRGLVWVDSLTRKAQYMVNGKDFMSAGQVPFTGFFQILADGKITLLRRTEVIVKNPDFHPALNVGSRDYRIIKKHQTYYAIGREARPWGGKKQALSIFEEKESEVREFIKVNRLDLSKEEHVLLLFEHVNRLAQ